MNPCGLRGLYTHPARQPATRHIHQVIEMAHSGDILGGIGLLVEALKSLDTWDWNA